MSDKNDILEEQRKAREEFLKLKKMQQGEIDAGPKPSEVAIVPKTPKEKAANFWFQYKWHTIGIVAAVIVLAVLVAQCVSRPVYDMELVYFTYSPILDEQTTQIAEYFEEFAEDLDGNGEVNVQAHLSAFLNTLRVALPVSSALEITEGMKNSSFIRSAFARKAANSSSSISKISGVRPQRFMETGTSFVNVYL